MHSLRDHAHHLTQCAYCPSLCRHVCPVAAADPRDSVTPWGLMGLAHHVHTSRLRLTDDMAEILNHCTSCGACTRACGHAVPVANVLASARAGAVALGRQPIDIAAVRAPMGIEDRRSSMSEIRRRRWRRESEVLLLTGSDLVETAQVDDFLLVCERMEEVELGIGEASGIDLGVGLWQAGFFEEFERQAKAARIRLASAKHLVVLSAEALHVLRHVYPAHGIKLNAHAVHATDFLLPFVYGARLDRVPGRVAFYEPCHFLRNPRPLDVGREILARVLEDSPVDLRANTSELGCCGGAGCLKSVAPETVATMAEAVIVRALEEEVERLVVMAPECTPPLRAASNGRLPVDDLSTVLAESVRGAS